MSKLKDQANQDKLNAFFSEYAPLIKLHVTKLKSQGLLPNDVDESDLHLAGFRGLMEAAHRYNPEVAARTSKTEGSNVFAKYASTRIRGKMLDHVNEKYSDHVPKHIRTQAKNFAKLNSTQAPQPEAETVVPTPPKPVTED